MGSRRLLNESDLPQAFNAPDDPGAAAELWQVHLDAPTDSTRNALAEHYLPLVVRVCLAKASRHRRSGLPPVDEMIAEGCVGLLKGIERIGDASRLRQAGSYLVNAVIGQVWDSVRKWRRTREPERR